MSLHMDVTIQWVKAKMKLIIRWQNYILYHISTYVPYNVSKRLLFIN